jgi:3-methyl-2-oxobutanoate hydroxymethyltransferase
MIYMDVLKFKKVAAERKLSMVTCYDSWSAKIINATAIDCVLVGDSLGMVMHGYTSTVPVTVDLMEHHVRAVASSIKDKLIIADMPFLSYQQGGVTMFKAVQRLMQAGAHAVKLEGCDGFISHIESIVQAGVPVMGHLGLTPQSVHQLGGYKVQGRETDQAEHILRQAQSLQQAGCFGLVLECVPSTVAQSITEHLHIPTIGIGAGPDTSGQVLVLHDLLGLQSEFSPKFLKQYCDGFTLLKTALNEYDAEVKDGIFPCKNRHAYAAKKPEPVVEC